MLVSSFALKFLYFMSRTVKKKTHLKSFEIRNKNNIYDKDHSLFLRSLQTFSLTYNSILTAISIEEIL